MSVEGTVLLRENDGKKPAQGIWPVNPDRYRQSRSARYGERKMPKILSGNGLKLIAAVSMTVDHIGGDAFSTGAKAALHWTAGLYVCFFL